MMEFIQLYGKAIIKELQSKDQLFRLLDRHSVHQYQNDYRFNIIGLEW